MRAHLVCLGVLASAISTPAPADPFDGIVPSTISTAAPNAVRARPLATTGSAAPIQVAEDNDDLFPQCMLGTLELPTDGRPVSAATPEQRLAACTELIDREDNTEVGRNSRFFARVARGRVYRELGRFSEAIADHDAAVAAQSGNSSLMVYPALASRARTRDAMGDHAGAMADYAAALALEPSNPAILLARARSRDAAGDYAGAITDATAALSNGGDHVLVERARLYFAHGDFDAAMADLAASVTAAETRLQALRNRLPPNGVASSPEIAQLYNERCWMRAVAGRDLDAARRECDEAFRIIAGRLDDLAASIFDSRGLVGLRQGRNQDALEDYEIAARLRRPAVSIPPAAPEAGARFAHALYGRGVAANRLGRTGEAQRDFEGAAHWDADVAATYSGYGVTP